MSMRETLSVLLLALSVLGAARPVLAEEKPARVGLIMSGLPASSSPEYKALRKLAGKNAEGQALDMTKSEMWNVTSDRAEEVIATASRQGVTVTRLDESWNHTLAPMSPGAEMTAEQKDMMHSTMESKAVMGASMMGLPQANVMEYALTKGMSQPASGDNAPTLVIPLNEKTSLTARRKSITKTADGYVWRGAVEGTNEDVTLMWWPGGRLTGTVSHQGHMYAIKSMGGSMHGVVEMAPEAFPPEHAPMSAEQKQKMNMRVDPMVKQGDARMMEQQTPAANGSLVPDLGRTRNLEDAPLGHEARRAAQRLKTYHARTRRGRGPKPVEITLLVAYTKAAASHYNSIDKDLIALAVEDTNQSFRSSGLGNIRVKLVHSYQTDYVEKGGQFDHVYAFFTKGDGVMDEVHALRDQYRADVAVLIVHDPMGCGLAARVGAEADRAFAVTHHECVNTTYSLAHEIGHLIGARHDIGLDDSLEPFPYGHGFVNGTQWRTMMSYKDSCGGCPRLPVWSNPNITVRGIKAGNAQSNNAKVIAEEAARVAAFR